MAVEGSIDFGQEQFEVKGLVSFVGGVLTNWADEALAAAIGVDADEVEDFALVKITFVAFKISDS